MIRGFEMKKKCDKLLGILCYALGILAALYVENAIFMILLSNSGSVSISLPNAMIIT